MIFFCFFCCCCCSATKNHAAPPSFLVSLVPALSFTRLLACSLVPSLARSALRQHDFRLIPLRRRRPAATRSRTIRYGNEGSHADRKKWDVDIFHRSVWSGCW
uniref:Secreted peptide n=1 Tax=Anopheles braziliensis TaxID=58242 RepID=A0A2M3ZM55_9DIPT